MLKDKLQVFDEVLIDEDFNNYWNTKAVDIPELDEVAQSTRKKVKQVLIRLLVEAGILSKTNNPLITPIYPTTRIENLLAREGANYRAAFLT